MDYEHLNRTIDALGVDRESTVAEQCRKMLDEEYEEQRQWWRKNNPRCREPYGELYVQAASNIVAWYNHCEEYRISINNLSSIRDFVATHRRPCTWAVLLGLEHKAGLGREHRTENTEKKLDTV